MNNKAINIGGEAIKDASPKTKESTMAQASQEAAQNSAHEITYFVNGESETTTQRELTVRQILESAGFAPATDYLLESENPPRKYEGNYGETVRIHPNQRFLALFKAPTPVSQAENLEA